ncbi:hypothetical protein ACFQZS_10590 [Mucilaginibacter calamicampi]|uniref:O-Antigen ligase n=1 Tax=Mucilaginibacter calamicampi TaxID=1302352 RepID=A0ABW2YVU9_9SPHI
MSVKKPAEYPGMYNSFKKIGLKKVRAFADWKLLLLLLLFLNVKLAIKIPAIILVYLLDVNFKFGFSFKNSRLPLFYPVIIVIGLIAVIINKDYSAPNYPLVLGIGVLFWMLCILAIHQVKLSVEKSEVAVIHQTLLIFFIVNAVFSLFNLVAILAEIGITNPYTYRGQYQKYFLSTGDFIKGLTFDTSTNNAIISAFGVIYYFTLKKPVMLLVCMVVLLLTGSNFTNLALLLILIPLLVFKSNRDQKSLLMVCGMLFIVFMTKISPENNKYVVDTFKNIAHIKNPPAKPDTLPIPLTLRADSTLDHEEKRQKLAMLYLDSLSAQQTAPVRPAVAKKVFTTDAGRVFIPQPSIHTPPFQGLKVTPAGQIPLVKFISAHKKELHLAAQAEVNTTLPGKLQGHLQTLRFFIQHPAKILTGDGMGNFSSKLAFRASGIGVTGTYPAKYVYIDPDFKANHLDLYLEFFSKRGDYHSLTHSPFSVYDQMLGEYGLLGLAALFVLYIAFFARHYKQLTYGIPIIALVLIIFFIDYWFEQLSVLVLFELLLFLNIKEGQKPVDYAD